MQKKVVKLFLLISKKYFLFVLLINLVLLAKKAKDNNKIGPTNPIPGYFVSVDTNIAGTPGIIPIKVGRLRKERYNSSTLWVDKTLKLLWIDHQIANDACATLKSKISFLTIAESYDQKTCHIHSDNRIVSSKSFVNHCRRKRQRQSFCGAGAHQQNGSAERFGITTTKTCIILIDAMYK